VLSVKGDYARIDDDLCAAIKQGADKRIKDEETLAAMEMLETGVAQYE